MFLYTSAVGGGGNVYSYLCRFLSFPLFFSLSLSFSFSFSFISVSQVAGPHGIFFFSFSVRLWASKHPRSPINSNFFFIIFFLWSMAPFVNVTPSPPSRYLSLLTMSLLTPAGDQLVVEGVTHISCHHKNTIGGTEKIEGQTNKHEQSLGLTKSRGRYATLCIPDSIYGLTLAWVTSETSTSTSNADISWLTVAGPYPMLPRLSAPVSGVDCPCPWFHANSLLLASLLSSANCPLLGPWSTLFRVPFPLPDTARFPVQESFVWYRAKTDKGIICFGSLLT